MPPSVFHLSNHGKLQPTGINIDSSENLIENELIIHETYDRINMITEPPHMGLESLVDSVGSFVKDGADLITGPIKWFNHMKENW
jgi:hypothetical protein